MTACRPCRVRRLLLPFTPTAFMRANQQNARVCGHPVTRSGGCQTAWSLHWSSRSTQRTATTGAGLCGDGMSTLSGGIMVVRPGSGTSGFAARTSAFKVASRRLTCWCRRRSSDGRLRLTRGSSGSRDSALTTLGRAVCEENPGRCPALVSRTGGPERRGRSPPKRSAGCRRVRRQHNSGGQGRERERSAQPEGDELVARMQVADRQ